MTREEQKMIRELTKAVEKGIRNVGKKYGYKSISGIAYKVVKNYIYEVLVSVPPAGLGKQIDVQICFKPVLLDDIFWEVFEMEEEARSQPFSFHIIGAFTPYCHTIEKWSIPYEMGPQDLGQGYSKSIPYKTGLQDLGQGYSKSIPYEKARRTPEQGYSESTMTETDLEMAHVLDIIFREADDIVKRYSCHFRTVGDFKNEICHCDDPMQKLNVILCEIAEGNDCVALDLITSLLENGESGGFASGSGGDILEYAKRYCEERLKE